MLLKIFVNCCILSMTFVACKQQIEYKHIAIDSNYSLVALTPTPDSIVFEIDSIKDMNVKSFNYFTKEGKEFLCILERHGPDIYIYDIGRKSIVMKLSLKDVFKNRPLYKTSVYCKSIDSICIYNHLSFYLVDINGKIKDSIECKTNPYFSIASFDNLNPPVTYGDYIFAEARPRLDNTDKDNLSKWRVLYKFDMKRKQAKTVQELPDLYKENLFSYSFFYNSYCFNDKGCFVFSFPADTNIYETNLKEHFYSYQAKSSFQKEEITPADKSDLNSSEGDAKNFLLTHSYGAIYYDQFHKVYLRVSKQKVSRKAFVEKNWRKKQSLVIIDQNFKVIGETEFPDDVDLSFSFITPTGDLYVRSYKSGSKSLNFVKYKYTVKVNQTDMAKHQNDSN